jgi:hypothetical protein
MILGGQMGPQLGKLFSHVFIYDFFKKKIFILGTTLLEELKFSWKLPYIVQTQVC